MSTMRLLTKVAPISIILAVFFIGTPLQAHTYTWAGTTVAWDQSTNWTSPTGTSFPGTGDVAILDGSVAIVPTIPSTSVTVGTLNITGDQTIHLDGALVVGDLNISSAKALTLTKTTRGGMTINGLASFASGARLQGGGSLLPVSVTISSTGTISMPDCETTKTTFIGENIKTVVGNPTFMQSAVRIDGPMDISNVAVKLAYYNLYLGVNATLSGASGATNGSNDNGAFYHVNGDFPTSPDPQGRVCWEYTSTDQSHTFPVGTVTGLTPTSTNTAGVTNIEIAMGSSCTTGSFDVANTTPFPYISVRSVFNHNAQHPDAAAAATLWYYWSVKGVGVPASVGLVGRVSFHNNYRSNDPNIYSAIYSDNVENYDPNLMLGSWYLTGSHPGTKVGSTQYVEFGPYATNSTSPCMPGFGDISVGSGSGGLIPVELTSFSARYFDGSVRLNWQTATELNNHGFYVERSLNGEGWEEIAFIDGAGTSNVPLSYKYNDLLERGLKDVPQIAYRLRQEDRDGTTDYSGIVYAYTGAQPDRVELYKAYPNPFNPSTTLSFSLKEASHVSLKVFNSYGQEVATVSSRNFDAGFHTMEFDGANLPSGVYIAVLDAAGVLQQQKLVLSK